MEELNAENKSVLIETSRNGQPIPVINEVYLHSIYNPEKEANALAQSFRSSLETKTTILVLGLGFGYHVKALAQEMQQMGKEFAITIVEPRLEVIESFNIHQNFSPYENQIKIVTAETAREIYENRSFIDFLMTKPAIIKHEPSFEVNTQFFKDFLTYRAPERIEKFRKLIDEQALEKFPSDLKLSIREEIVNIRNRGRISSPRDRMLFILDAISKSAKSANQRPL